MCVGVSVCVGVYMCVCWCVYVWSGRCGCGGVYVVERGGKYCGVIKARYMYCKVILGQCVV